MGLTAEQRRLFAESGYVAVEDVVPSEHVTAMRQRIEELCERCHSEDVRRMGVQQEMEVAGATATVQTAQTVRKIANLVAHEPVFHAHATAAPLLARIADLIGTPISLYEDYVLLKPPFVGSARLLHQDNAYFQVVPDEAVLTCWCALDDATVENGCMHYIPGTHRLGVLDHERVPGTPHRVPTDYHAEEAVPAPIKAGGVIFHHGCTLHYSPANNTGSWRRAFACHFVRSDAAIPGKAPSSLLRVR
jgi:ectoine hydroxylase-related dioxygenase (phytanoyl-CoA dioxygenase family)